MSTKTKNNKKRSAGDAGVQAEAAAGALGISTVKKNRKTPGSPVASSVFKLSPPNPASPSSSPAKGALGVAVADSPNNSFSVNNFKSFNVDLMARRLKVTADENGKLKFAALIKAKPYPNSDGRTVQPRIPYKLDYSMSSEYVNVVLKLQYLDNNGEVEGDWTKLTMKGFLIDPSTGEIDSDAFKRAASFGAAFQEYLYTHRNNLPFVWSKGSDVGKNVAGGMKSIAAATQNASYSDIKTLPEHQKYRVHTDFETGVESYINANKEPIGLVEDGKPPPEGAIQVGNKYFKSRFKPNGQVQIDFNYPKVTEVVDALSGKPLDFMDLTAGSVLKFRLQTSLYALPEQKIVGATAKAPVGRDPKLEVLWLNPKGQKINPDQKFLRDKAQSASSSTNNYAAERNKEETKQLAATVAATMAAKMGAAY